MTFEPEGINHIFICHSRLLRNVFVWEELDNIKWRMEIWKGGPLLGLWNVFLKATTGKNVLYRIPKKQIFILKISKQEKFQRWETILTRVHPMRIQNWWNLTSFPHFNVIYQLLENNRFNEKYKKSQKNDSEDYKRDVFPQYFFL